MALEQHFEAARGLANVVRISLPPDVFEHLGELRSKQVVLGHFFYPAVRLVPGEPTVATVVREPVDSLDLRLGVPPVAVQHPDHAVLASRGIRSVEEFAEEIDLAGHVRDNQTRLLGVEYDVAAVAAAFEAGEIDLDGGPAPDGGGQAGAGRRGDARPREGQAAADGGGSDRGAAGLRTSPRARPGRGPRGRP